MSMATSAGRPAQSTVLLDVSRLVWAYHAQRPDPAVPAQRVALSSAGHRGCPFNNGFNEQHVLAITQAICLHRQKRGIDGPLYLGMDTHALSTPAMDSVLEVLAANDVEVMVAARD